MLPASNKFSDLHTVLLFKNAEEKYRILVLPLPLRFAFSFDVSKKICNPIGRYNITNLQAIFNRVNHIPLPEDIPLAKKKATEKIFAQLEILKRKRLNHSIKRIKSYFLRFIFAKEIAINGFFSELKRAKKRQLRYAFSKMHLPQ